MKAVSIALFIVISGLSGTASGQTPQKGQPSSPQSSTSDSQQTITTQQGVTIEAQPAGEDIEEGKLNDAYQPILKMQQQQDFQNAIEKYRSVLIPLAEQAKFDLPKNKFLFLGYRGIANCALGLGNFADAEDAFQKLFDYIPVWPGKDSSDYPISFEGLAMSQMGQRKWKDAGESLEMAVSIFGEQIAVAVTFGSEQGRKERANGLRMSQDISLNLLAEVYYREKRPADALDSVEKAYNQAMTFQVPPSVLKQIVDNGRAISIGAGNDAATATWSQRSTPAN